MATTKRTGTTPVTRTRALKPKPTAVVKPEAKVVTTAELADSAEELKKSELVDEAVERSGVKKRFAKPAIEAAIEVLAEALAEGRQVNIKPLGKVDVRKVSDKAKARVIVTRIRQQLSVGEENADFEGVADAAE